jgi:exodeoxyribonuclease V alpha subunit
MFEAQGADLHHYFARFLADRCSLSSSERNSFYDLVRRLCLAMEEGHSCLLLTAAEQQLTRTIDLVTEDGENVPAPLVLCGSRLYLHRYYSYETRLAGQILQMVDGVSEDAAAADGPFLQQQQLFTRLFPGCSQEKDYQRDAVEMARSKQLTIISGGPGTGKTTTVAKMLAVIVAGQEVPPKIGLAAPTGKAAARLAQSIGDSLKQLPLPESIKEVLPDSATTLHRLLGVRRHSPDFLHNHKHPLPYDVVVVDEASMVDLAMMSKLVDALAPGTKLILLGDKDQLASVESGAVLADLIGSLPGNSVILKKSYRFETTIKKLSDSINSADIDRALSLLKDPEIVNVSLLLPEELDYLTDRYIQYMQQVKELATGKLLTTVTIKQIFSTFRLFQVLCGVHYGDRGVQQINQLIERGLVRRGYNCSPESWYTGRPVLITRNDYSVGLYNGDIGICLPDQQNGSMKVWFETVDGAVRGYWPNRLPQNETVFAMTIHKSQGSEFDEVVVILPREDNRVLCHELLYTGVTRAKSAVRIVTEEAVFVRAVQRSVRRHSGLQHFFSSRGVFEK